MGALEKMLIGAESEEGSSQATASHAYTGIKGRIVDFLGSGCAPSVVASAVGVDASYVSQLLADEEFAKAVTSMRLESLQAKTSRDAKYDSLEDRLLEALSDVIAFMSNPRDILQALGVVNSAKRRGVGDEMSSVGTNNTIVNLVLPTVMIPKFITNENNQVIDVDGQTMVTLGARSLESLEAREREALT